MFTTWYVLEDGSTVDPCEVAPDVDGRLMHKSGVPVAMKGQVPHSMGVDLTRHVEAEKPKAGYKTRAMKAAK